MAERRARKPKEDPPKRRPARTPKAREDQLISLAIDTAEEQMRSGTASAQVVTHFLKLGSSREKLEQLRLASEVDLLEVKKEAIASQKRVEELYTQALDAMRAYSGSSPRDVPTDEFDD